MRALLLRGPAVPTRGNDSIFWRVGKGPRQTRACQRSLPWISRKDAEAQHPTSLMRLVLTWSHTGARDMTTRLNSLSFWRLDTFNAARARKFPAKPMAPRKVLDLRGSRPVSASDFWQRMHLGHDKKLPSESRQSKLSALQRKLQIRRSKHRLPKMYSRRYHEIHISSHCTSAVCDVHVSPWWNSPYVPCMQHITASTPSPRR